MDELILDWLRPEFEEEDEDEELLAVQEDSPEGQSPRGPESEPPSSDAKGAPGPNSIRSGEPHVATAISAGNTTSADRPIIPRGFRRGLARWRKAG